jgi:hypothetical protein
MVHYSDLVWGSCDPPRGFRLTYGNHYSRLPAMPFLAARTSGHLLASLKTALFFKDALVYGHARSPSLIDVAVYGSMADILRPVTPRPQSASLSRQHATNATGLGNDRLTGGGMTRPVPPCPKNR